MRLLSPRYYNNSLTALQKWHQTLTLTIDVRPSHIEIALARFPMLPDQHFDKQKCVEIVVRNHEVGKSNVKLLCKNIRVRDERALFVTG